MFSNTRIFLPIWLFSLAALLPPVLLLVGLVMGGPMAWAGFIAMTAFAALMDRFTPGFTGNAPQGSEFPAADPLLAILAVFHIGLLPVIVFYLAGDAPLADKAALFLGASLWLGQISNPVAHELIHRGSRALYWLGLAMFSMVLFGHHTSAHRLVHHVHAATPQDPNTARSGEGFYAFFLRAWRGSFMRGLRAENELRARRSGRAGLHPYALYLCISAGSLAFAYGLAGFFGAAIWVLLSLSAQAQLLLSDYVQHYGLPRARLAGDKYEPVQDRHSWNAPHWYSSAMMVNAPRHSDHHAHPNRPYPALRLPLASDAPRLPWPLPLACTIALFPPVWKRRIRPHLKPWLLPRI